MTVQTYIHVSDNLQTLVYTSAPLFTIVVEYISVSKIFKWTLLVLDVLMTNFMELMLESNGLHIHKQDDSSEFLIREKWVLSGFKEMLYSHIP